MRYETRKEPRGDVFAVLFVLVLILGAITILVKLGQPSVTGALVTVPTGNLSCTFEAATSCSSGVKVLGLSNGTNAHAELANESNYAGSICCTDTSGNNTLSTTGGTTFLRLFSSTNAHVEVASNSNYNFTANISANNANISCSVNNTGAGSCDPGFGCVATLSSTTNAHAANCSAGAAYNITVCCSIGGQRTFYFAPAEGLAAALTANGSVNGTLVNGTDTYVTQTIQYLNTTSGQRFLELEGLFNASTVNADLLTIEQNGSAVAVNTSGLTGASNNHTIFLENNSAINNEGVTVCPSAETLGDVIDGCSGQLDFLGPFPQTISGVTVSLEGDDFRVDNLTTTGVMLLTISNSSINNSNITNSTVINSTINGSNITNSTVINSTIINSSKTNSTIIDSTVNLSTNVNCGTLNSTEQNVSCANSTIENSTVTDSNITNSTKLNSNITNSSIDSSVNNNCQVSNSTEQNGTCVDSNLTDSVVVDSNVTNSTKINSSVLNTSNVGCTVQNSNESDTQCDNSTIIDSNVDNSTVTNSTKLNATVLNTTNIGCTVQNSTEIGANCSNSNITDSIIQDSNVTETNVTNSTKIDSTLTGSVIDNSTNDNCTVTDSTETGSTCSGSTIEDSTVEDSTKELSSVINSTNTNSTVNMSVEIDSNVTNSTVTNSTLQDTNVTESVITNSTKINSTIINSTIENSNNSNCIIINGVELNSSCTNSILNNTRVENSTLIQDMNITNGTVLNDVCISGNVTYNGQTFECPIALIDIIVPPLVLSGPGGGSNSMQNLRGVNAIRVYYMDSDDWVSPFMQILDQVKFDMPDGQHTLTLIGVQSEKLVVRVASTFQQFDIPVGTAGIVDVNFDSVPDLEVKMQDRIGGRVKLHMRMLTEADLAEKPQPLEPTRRAPPPQPATASYDSVGEPLLEQPEEQKSSPTANAAGQQDAAAGSSFILASLLVLAVLAVVASLVWQKERKGKKGKQETVQKPKRRSFFAGLFKPKKKEKRKLLEYHPEYEQEQPETEELPEPPSFEDQMEELPEPPRFEAPAFEQEEESGYETLDYDERYEESQPYEEEGALPEIPDESEWGSEIEEPPALKKIRELIMSREEYRSSLKDIHGTPVSKSKPAKAAKRKTKRRAKSKTAKKSKGSAKRKKTKKTKKKVKRR